MRGVYGGTTINEKIKNLNDRIKRWYTDTKCESKLRGVLTADKVRTSGNWPKLKGKAAPIRHIARFVLELVLEHMADSDEDKRILAVIQLLVRFYEIIMTESMFLREEARQELNKNLGFALACCILYWHSQLFKHIRNYGR